MSALGALLNRTHRLEAQLGELCKHQVIKRESNPAGEMGVASHRERVAHAAMMLVAFGCGELRRLFDESPYRRTG